MDSCLLDVLHDRADQDICAVRDCITVDLDCVFEKVIDQDRMIGRYPNSFPHVPVKVIGIVHNLHCPPAKNIRGAHEHRIADLVGR